MFDRVDMVNVKRAEIEYLHAHLIVFSANLVWDVAFARDNDKGD